MSAKKNSLKKLYRLLLNAIEDVSKVEVQINTKYRNNAKKDLDQIARIAIDEFYESYTPNKYDRYGSLYSAYKVNVNKNVWEILTDSSFITTSHHQKKNSIIYNNVFELGYHGGSTGKGLNSGIPHWRKPFPFFTEWGDVAAHSTPPIETIQERYNQYMDEIPIKLQDEFDKKTEAIIKPIKAQIDYMSS